MVNINKKLVVVILNYSYGYGNQLKKCPEHRRAVSNLSASLRR